VADRDARRSFEDGGDAMSAPSQAEIQNAIKRSHQKEQAEHQAQQMLSAALQSSLTDPFTITQHKVALLEFTPLDPDGSTMLHVALPQAQRIDVILNPSQLDYAIAKLTQIKSELEKLKSEAEPEKTDSGIVLP
jgi:hypothetical protein